MINNYLLQFLFLSILIFHVSIPSYSQNLPSEMHISEDGKRLISGGKKVNGFYDESTFVNIELQFDQTNFWSIMENNYDSRTDIPATLIIDGEIFDSVGVHFKGKTSYSRNRTDKKSFNITLDFIHDEQNILGYETLNLNCGYDDPSSIREVLFNSIGRNYTPALKSNFALLKINGADWGPYANVQQLNSDYLREWFLSNDGTSWRALRKGGGGPGGPGGPGGNPFGAGTSTLNYLGPDTASYIPHYTLKRTEKENPWSDLVLGCDKLNNLPLNQMEDSLKYYLDVDKALWFLAHEIIFTDEDSYVWKGGMDYYVYWEAETQRLIPLEYDGNSCMSFNAVNRSLFYNESNIKFPLLNRLFAVPAYRQRYLAHVRTILEEFMDPEKIEAKIDFYVSMLAQHIQDDPKKIYSYNEFLNEIEELKDFVEDRRNFLLNNNEVNVEGLEINNVEFSVNGIAFNSPDKNEEVVVIASVNGSSGVQNVQLYFAPGFVGPFEKTEMFDDGLHEDGGANDGIFGGTIPGFDFGNYVRFYIEAIADDAVATATYHPEGAEHDVFIYRVNLAGTVNSDVVINEFMASNDTIIADQDGEYDDWIELYNNSNEAKDLSGWKLTDKENNLDKWAFPQGTIIEGNEYLIVWADKDGSQEGLHTNFKLSASGEILVLLDTFGNVAQEVIFEEQTTDMSYSRIPNGTGDFVIKAPTFSENNEVNSSISYTNGISPNFKIYPNPARDLVNIDIEYFRQEEQLEIFNVLGQKLYESQIVGNFYQLNTNDWPSGIYIVKIGNAIQMLDLH